MLGRTIVLGAVLALTGRFANAAPTVTKLGVPGLEKPASIVVDRWGIPHIFAASEHDAYFLQGYNAARDRLWQIDLWRKRGLGLLAGSFGRAFVEQDRAARLFLYRGDMNAEWAAYAPGLKGIVEAFTAGINAYVMATRTGAAPLPREFTLTASTPDLWRPADVVRIRSHALVGNLSSEVARARVTCAGGVYADRLRKKLEPPHPRIVPQGLDTCDIGPDVLTDYKLATQAVSFSASTAKVVADADDSLPNDLREGSNNWVIAPSRTATGRPILANDPHRQLVAPSLRYLVQLNAPGLSIIGAGEPALPGVSFGHNDTVAWGLTIFGDDQEDLYIYALNPAHPDEYRYGAAWEPMTIVRETIPVKGEASRDVTLRFTRHGPVISTDAAHGRAFAVRTVWGQPGAAGYLQATWLTHATNWADFMRARGHWGAPPLNLVYADTAGHIGWAAGALTPARPNWDGLLPVPGDGRYEWRGFLDPAKLPSIEDPAKGWFATANEMNLPSGYPDEERRVSFEWADRSRIDRIDAVLAAVSRQTVAGSMALQTDTYSTLSARLTALTAPLHSPDAKVERALAMLRDWNHDETTDSVATTIYEVWTSKRLGRDVARKLTTPAAQALIGAGSVDAVVTVLEFPDKAFGPDPARARDALLLASLADTLDDISTLLGPDMNSWQWGRLHRAVFEPAAAVFASPAERERMKVGPEPLPGGPSTPRAAGYFPTDFNAEHGASARMVMDVGDWDKSMVIDMPGESADPASPHYRDHFVPWVHGDYVPFLFSRKAVDLAAETVIEVSPATAP